MHEEIAVSIALTNISNKQINQEAISSLHAKLGSKLRWPNPPAGITGASVDLWAIASRISDVLQIGATLWAVYETAIRPKFEDSRRQGIYIVLPSVHGNQTFWLGKQYKDKEIFLRDWNAAASNLSKIKKKSSRARKTRRRKAP